MGLVKTGGGTVSWNGKDITGSKTKDIVESGIVLVPEGRRVFPNLTVEENLTLGAYARSDKGEIEADLARLRERQTAAAFARARYYDRILHKPESALLEYRSFVSLYPDAPQAAEARARIALLKTEEKEK